MSEVETVFKSDRPLTNLDYSEEYYVEHKDAGLDYLGHGYWQEQYGLLVAEATLQSEDYPAPVIFDAGCACGSILKGFKKTNLFSRCIGMDLSEHMIKIGREHFEFSADELMHGSIADIPLPDESVTLVHSAQVLEHIPTSLMHDIFDELVRILAPGGRMFLTLDAIRHGENKEMYMGDPTHVNIQPIFYWTELLQSKGVFFDVEAYNRFVRSERGPTHGDPLSFFQQYPYWSTWTLIKPK